MQQTICGERIKRYGYLSQTERKKKFPYRIGGHKFQSRTNCTRARCVNFSTRTGLDANLSCCHKHNSRDHTPCVSGGYRERVRYGGGRKRASDAERGWVGGGAGEEAVEDDEDGGGQEENDGGGRHAERMARALEDFSPFHRISLFLTYSAQHTPPALPSSPPDHPHPPPPSRISFSRAIISSRSSRRRHAARARASVQSAGGSRAPRKKRRRRHTASVYSPIRPAGTRAPTAAAAENDGRLDACVVPRARGVGGGGRCGVCVRAVA